VLVIFWSGRFSRLRIGIWLSELTRGLHSGLGLPGWGERPTATRRLPASAQVAVAITQVAASAQAPVAITRVAASAVALALVTRRTAILSTRRAANGYAISVALGGRDTLCLPILKRRTRRLMFGRWR
jgi:hypothetical protein